MPLALSARRPRSASGSRPSRLCETSRTCPWHCLRGAHVQPVDPAFLCRRRPFLPQHQSESSENHFVLTQPLCDSFAGVFLCCGKQPKSNHTYRISVCSVKKARMASSCSPVAGVHIRIARRNPPVTDDHDLSNPNERYCTRLGGNELGHSTSPFKHIRRFTDTMQCSRKTCTKLLRLYAKKETSHWLDVCSSVTLAEHKRGDLATGAGQKLFRPHHFIGRLTSQLVLRDYSD